MVIKVQNFLESRFKNIPLIDEHLCHQLCFAAPSWPHNGDETMWVGINAFVHCLVEGGGIIYPTLAERIASIPEDVFVFVGARIK